MLVDSFPDLAIMRTCVHNFASRIFAAEVRSAKTANIMRRENLALYGSSCSCKRGSCYSNCWSARRMNYRRGVIVIGDAYRYLLSLIGDVYKIAIINYRRCILLPGTHLNMASTPIAYNTYSPIIGSLHYYFFFLLLFLFLFIKVYAKA